MRTDDALIRLEMSQLVRRQRDGQDRRLVWLRLTDAGREQVTEALRRYVAGASLVTEAMEEPELSASIAISGKLRLGAARLSLEPTLSTN
jgi:DNA-binding MarR family transcriptional regulator